MKGPASDGPEATAAHSSWRPWVGHRSYPGLRDSVVIVTGAGQGIGLALARGFAANGAAVVVADLRQDAADAAVLGITSEEGRAIACTADVTDPDDVDRLVGFVKAELGPPDILVNNVGFVRPYDPSNSILEMTKADWDHIVGANLTSAFLCTRAVAPLLVERGGGSIVNIASNIGRVMDITTGSHYAAAKAGLLHFTRHVARELAEHGVRVNAVSPGVTDTPRARSATSDAVRAQIIAKTPLGRIAEPEEIAGAVLFLASSDAGYITGSTIDVAGGRVMV